MGLRETNKTSTNKHKSKTPAKEHKKLLPTNLGIITPIEQEMFIPFL